MPKKSPVSDKPPKLSRRTELPPPEKGPKPVDRISKKKPRGK